MFERREPKPKPAFQHLRDDDAVRQQYSEALNAEMPSFESSDELPAELLNERITKGVLREEKMLKKSTKALCPPASLHKHFSDHFAARAVPPAPELHQLDQNQHLIPSSSLPEIDDTCPDLTEVQRAMKTLKNGRCRGCDGITGEQLKYCENIKLQRYVHAPVTRVCIHSGKAKGVPRTPQNIEDS